MRKNEEWDEGLIVHFILVFIMLFAYIGIVNNYYHSVTFKECMIVLAVVNVISVIIVYLASDVLMEMTGSRNTTKTITKEKEVQEAQELCNQIGLDVVVEEDGLPVFKTEYLYEHEQEQERGVLQECDLSDYENWTWHQGVAIRGYD